MDNKVVMDVLRILEVVFNNNIIIDNLFLKLKLLKEKITQIIVVKVTMLLVIEIIEFKFYVFFNYFFLI